MTRFRRLRSFCNFVTIVMISQLLVVQAMAASADFHKECHDHAHEPGHECVVTMILSGGYNSVVPDIVPVEFVPEQPPMAVVFPRVVDSDPTHLVGGVLAHAPPRGP